MFNANGLSPFRGEINRFIISVAHFKGYTAKAEMQPNAVEEPATEYEIVKNEQIDPWETKEVKKQYNQDPNWVEPYFIERFYEILDEHRSKKIGYNVDIIAYAMDAFYSNYDNGSIPILEAIRIVSL